jgi:hypothetical protein
MKKEKTKVKKEVKPKAPKAVKPKAKASRKGKANINSGKNFLVTLTIGEMVFTAKNKNLVDALMNLRPTVRIKFKATLKVEHEGKSTSGVYNAKQLMHPLVSNTHAMFLAKQLIMRLK